MCAPLAAAVPAWLSYASMAATALGTGFSIYSGIQQGRAAQQQADMTAASLDQQARDRIQIGIEQEQDHRRRVAAMMADQTAGLAAAGVDTSSGSPLSVIGDTAMLGEADALRIRANTQRDINALGAQSGIARAEGRAARNSAYGNAFGSLLSGAGSVASQYYSMGPSVGPSGRVTFSGSGPTRSVALRR